MGWNICDSVFCIRGAKRDPIHTSLTRCVLKRLLSTRHNTAEEAGARYAFRPEHLHSREAVKNRQKTQLFLVFLRSLTIEGSGSNSSICTNWKKTQQP